VITANEIAVNQYISKEWMAFILLPTVRAVAGMCVGFDEWPLIVIHSSIDCVTAINVSVRDQLTLSSGVAIGSTIVSCLFCLCCGSIIMSSWVLSVGMSSNFRSSSFLSSLLLRGLLGTLWGCSLTPLNRWRYISQVGASSVFSNALLAHHFYFYFVRFRRNVHDAI